MKSQRWEVTEICRPWLSCDCLPRQREAMESREGTGADRNLSLNSSLTTQ